jgi:uncharacterized membrane protein YphA (DoxX/SURF4 family)
MTVVGVRPWLPGSLGKWAWFNDPVRAERLAALRIGVALCLLLDILGTYIPHLSDYYGSGSLASPDVFADRFQSPHWHWSILRWLPETWGPPVLAWIWVGAGVALLVGWRPQLAAAIAWALSLSFYNTNYYLHNSGDRLRHTLLFFLMIAPCGAVWAISRIRKTPSPPSPLPQSRERGEADLLPSPGFVGEGTGVRVGFAAEGLGVGFAGEGPGVSKIPADSLPNASRPDSLLPSPPVSGGEGPGARGDVFIYPWVLRLLFIQMTLIYFFNGVYKLMGAEWRDGTVMHYVLHDVGWSRISLPLPLWLERGSAWLVMGWELGFPLLILIPRLRVPTLVLGAVFHIVSGIQLELGIFPLYALCFYLPLVPWEKWI